MDYCVYKHTSPNGKVYIGVTSTSTKRRWGNGSGYVHNEHFYRAIQKYGWDNFTHEILSTGLSAEDAAVEERQLIALYCANDPQHGYNLTDGGERGKRHSPAAIAKMRRAKIGVYDGEKNPNYGKRASPETRMKISQALKGKMAGERNPNYGKPMTDAQKKLISQSRTGRHFPKLSEALRNSPACIAAHDKTKKPVAQYTREGDFVKLWDSAATASLYLIGRKGGQSNICSCANGKLKSAYGYIWKHSDENSEQKGGGMTDEYRL